MKTVAVISASGKKLMPTTAYRARKLLKSGRAKIYKYRPVFTIQLLDRKDGYTQPMEYSCDTGYMYIGVSVKSRKHEYVNRQYDLLPDEPERHNKRRKYRRTRRNRLRYRKPRWNNRKSLMTKGDPFAPSLRNKRDQHIQLFKAFLEVMPITKATFEMGQFDTQVLKAVEEGKPLPKGADYQHGERYGYDTLREAVFSRDDYTCVVCKKGIKQGKILRTHHLGYLKCDRSNRMSNLATVCTDCHTSKNHKKGGKLYGLEPKLKTFKGATFMTAVRWDMYQKLKEACGDEVEFNITYGAVTKEKRKELDIKKTHSNDAYCIGEYHPKHRADFEHLQKQRRNNRILRKFYDAKYIDVRDGSTKSGVQLSCGRTNRSVSRRSELNECIYRGKKVKKGSYSIRKTHYSYRPGNTVWTKKYGRCEVKGVMNCGATVLLANGKSVQTGKILKTVHCGGWRLIEKTA